jgi:hypothetical protein
MEEEARAMITGLLTYLLFHHEQQDRINKFFTVSAVERASTSRWDLARNCVISEHDTVVEALDDSLLDADYLFEDIVSSVGPNQVADPATVTAPLNPAATATAAEDDADTVSTFRPAAAGTATVTPPAGLKKRKATRSVSSGLSMGTTETRLSTMESTLQAMVISQQEMAANMRTLMATQMGLHPGHPAAIAGAPSNSPRAGGSDAAGQAG